MTELPPTSKPRSGTRIESSRLLIDDLLAEQQDLSAVDQFARAHDAKEVRSRVYRDLLPATPPAAGQQYAFEVNLDLCSGCKACVSACHSLNGLDEGETWRSVGLLIDSPNGVDARRRKQGFQQNVTTACHHCVDPACLNGCPVLAYDKDSVTGIVRHLDDQCIGCQYCVMMCPYEVPQYSTSRGIVRKCDMCQARLAVDEAPACAQACPTRAIRIRVVDTAKVRAKYRWPTAGRAKTENKFLSTSPDPAITLPTTRFVTQRISPQNVFAGDESVTHPADGHLPLVMLLVLSQFAAGCSVASALIQPGVVLSAMALVGGLGAIAAGSFHLGQPWKAWRSFLGWRNSWFSREVIALSLFVFLTLLAGYGIYWGRANPKILCGLAGVAGVTTVGCSAMIYIKTRREYWSGLRTFGRFYGTTLLLGLAAVNAAHALANHPLISGLELALAILMAVKLGLEQRILGHLIDEETAPQSPLSRTARLLAGALNGLVRARIALGIMGGIVLPLISLVQPEAGFRRPSALPFVSLGLIVMGEFLERYLFFTAVSPQRMPGPLAS